MPERDPLLHHCDRLHCGDVGSSSFTYSMACGILLKLHDSPGPARAAAVRHANSSGHHAMLFVARRSQQ